MCTALAHAELANLVPAKKDYAVPNQQNEFIALKLAVSMSKLCYYIASDLVYCGIKTNAHHCTPVL
jgi:hypothetical protein